MFKPLGLSPRGFNLDGVPEARSLLPPIGLLRHLLCGRGHIAILQGGVKDWGVENEKLVMTGLGEGNSCNFKEMLKKLIGSLLRSFILLKPERKVKMENFPL